MHKWVFLWLRTVRVRIWTAESPQLLLFGGERLFIRIVNGLGVSRTLPARTPSAPARISTLVMMGINRITGWRCRNDFRISTISEAALHVNHTMWTRKTAVQWMLLSICWTKRKIHWESTFITVRVIKAYDYGSVLPAEPFAACGVAGFVLPVGYFAVDLLDRAALIDKRVGPQGAVRYFPWKSRNRCWMQMAGKLIGEHTCTRLHTQLLGFEVIFAFASGVCENSTALRVLFVEPPIFDSLLAVPSQGLLHAESC